MGDAAACEFLHPPHAQAVLDLLLEPLAGAGAEGELSIGLLDRLVDEPDAWGEDVVLLVACHASQPAALVIRTGRHPALVVGFGRADALDHGALVRELVRLGCLPTTVNGAERWSTPFAAAWEREAGAAATPARGLRAYELHEVRTPPDPGGAMRTVTDRDRDLLLAWTVEFGTDIGEEVTQEHAERIVARFIAGGDAVVWAASDGAPASMAAINRRTPWSSCVSYVYTPAEHRRRGYASAVVAALSKRELDAGREWCSLFTNVENPTSNHIYAEVGYVPRCDFREFALAWPEPPTPP